MKIFSPVAVALGSSCLVFFHSNPAFAAIIDIDAGAPPEDAALAPLDEPDDGTAAATSVIDATPAEAASVPNRRRRTLTGKKTGGGTPPTPAPPTPAPIACTGRSSTDGCNIVEEDIVDEGLPPMVFENKCTYDIMVRGALGADPPRTGDQDCNRVGNCFKVKARDRISHDVPGFQNGKTLFFSTVPYAELVPAGCYAQSFCAALETQDNRRNFNFDNQYSFGIPIGLGFVDDKDEFVHTCPESNLPVGYSVAGSSDNCYFDEMPCPPSAWKVKTSADDPVAWCVTNDIYLGVVSDRMDNIPDDCPAAPQEWVSQSFRPDGSREPPGLPLCHYNDQLELAASRVEPDGLKNNLIWIDQKNNDKKRLMSTLTTDEFRKLRPGGAKDFQTAVNDACGQYPTQWLNGTYPNFQLEILGGGTIARNIYKDGGQDARKDHAMAYEGDQKWFYTLGGTENVVMKAGSVAISCKESQFEKVKVTFCPDMDGPLIPDDPGSF